MDFEIKNAIQVESFTAGMDAPTKAVNAHLQHSKSGGMNLSCISNYLIRIPLILVLLIAIFVLTLELSTISKAQKVASISTSLTTVEENGNLVATINEGETIPFTLTMTGFHATNSERLLVQVVTESSGDAIVTPIHGQTTASFLVRGTGTASRDHSWGTTIDSTKFAGGQVIVKLGSDTSGVYTLNTDQKKAQFIVKVNNVVPRVVSISKPATPTEINEGEDFQVTLTSTPAPTTAEGDLPVTIMAADSDIGYFKSATPHPIMIGTSGMATATVSTNILPTTNPKTALTIEVGSDLTNTDINKRFVASTTDGSESIDIENVALTTVSIAKSSTLTSINEGESFEVTLTVSPMQTIDLPVTLTASDNDLGFLERFDPNPILIPANSESTTVTVHTNRLPSNDSTTTFRISVGQDITNSDQNLWYVAAEGTSGYVEVDIMNILNPTVQITSTAHERNVVESTGFTFTLMVTPAPPTDEVFPITLTLTPENTPYFDANFKLTYEIDSTGMLDVWVPTNLLGEDVDGDTIEIRIVENPDRYLIRNNYHNVQFAIAKIKDTSEPVISITSDADGESIGESKGFMFRLRANKALETDLDVNLTINDSGFIESDLTDLTIPTSGTLDVDVLTQANTESDEGGEIEISIAEHSSYHISGMEHQISVTILNISTVASISVADGPHPEGSTITFTITSSETPANPVTINVMLSEMDGDNILTSSPLTMRVGLSPTNTTEYSFFSNH